MNVFLASQSPRRAELLAQIAIAFDTVSIDVDETPHDDEMPGVYVERLGMAKSLAGARAVAAAGYGPGLVIGADTVVVLDGRIFGKPRDRNDALSQLSALSGRAHQVLTAVTVTRIGGAPAAAGKAGLAGASAPQAPSLTVVGSRSSRSRVWFRPLTEATIAAYWETGEPADKAGSYAIQGRAARFVSRLEGSYSGVMGLPVCEAAELLTQGGYALP